MRHNTKAIYLPSRLACIIRL